MTNMYSCLPVKFAKLESLVNRLMQEIKLLRFSKERGGSISKIMVN